MNDKRLSRREFLTLAGAGDGGDGENGSIRLRPSYGGQVGEWRNGRKGEWEKGRQGDAGITH